MSLPPSGGQYEIRVGEYAATVVEVGGGLRQLSFRGRPLLDGYALDEMAPAGCGQPLIPWPNRVRNGRYSFDGQLLQLPINEVDRETAIHGLTRWLNWSVAESSDDHIELRVTLHPQPGYPFMLQCSIHYRLSARGLDVATRVTNLGGEPLPLGIGFHPYLLPNPEGVDGLVFTLPAGAALSTGDKGIADGEPNPVSGGDLDFRSPRRIGGQALDTCFTDLERDSSGFASAELELPDRDGVRLWLDGELGYVMVFTADTVEGERRRRSLAVEPMTCPPNAFQTGRALRVLEPGAAFACRWGLEAFSR